MRTAKKIIRQSIIYGSESIVPLSEAEEFKLMQYGREIDCKFDKIFHTKLAINRLLMKNAIQKKDI